MDGIQRTIFNLPNVIKAVQGDFYVWVVEGEKDVLSLSKLQIAATCNTGGAGKWLPSFEKYFHDAHVVISPDNDKQGCNHARDVACSLYPVVKEIRIVKLPVGYKGDVSDWLTAGGDFDSLKSFVDDAPIWHPGDTLEPWGDAAGISEKQNNDAGTGLPEVITSNRQDSDILAECLGLLEESNKQQPELFVRSGVLCQVATDEHNNPSIKQIGRDHILNRLSKLARFVTVTANGEQKNSHVPKIVAKLILAEPTWPFPAIETISQCPCVRPDGTISSKPGYDRDTRTYNHFLDTDVLVPEQPVKTDVEAAKTLINELICDFPFDSEASRTNYIGMLLTSVLRPAVTDCIPLYLIDAPQAGSGKSLLSQILGILATGECPHFLTAPVKPEDWPKVITSILSTGQGLAIFDNIAYSLSSGDLAAVLTTGHWQARVFGSNTETVSLPNRTM